MSINNIKLQNGGKRMNTLDAIFTRKSVRDFSDKRISDEDLRTILRAGMSGPSAVNTRPWHFVVVRDEEIINKMVQVNGRAAGPLWGADLGIMVCGDLDRAFKPAPGYWVVDSSIACQNMMLAARELGIGSVMLGTYPQEERVLGQAELFGVPDNIVPFAIIALGYPAEGETFEERDLYEEEKVHYDKW